MWQLYEFTLCPFSRKVRLLLGEKGVGYDIHKERPWTRRDEFIDLNPAGETPVMVDADKGTTLIDSAAICEYFEETVDKAAMISGTAANRAEIRRLTAWFDNAFWRDVSGPLIEERMKKRIIPNSPAPNAAAMREAMKGAVSHLDYTDYLLGHRKWLAGATLTLADLAGAAHISVADYLGGIDWRNHEETARWYRGIKSRPTMRAILAERMEGIVPPKHYDDPDF